MSDFLAFCYSAHWILKGEYRSLYPLPFVYLFIPFTFIPPLWGYLILTAISIFLLVNILKRKALLWIFYVPILQVLFLGQIDIIIWWLITKKNPIGMAFATLKPHIFLIFGFPTLWKKWKERDWKFLKPFMITWLLIYVPFFIIRPMWPVEWLFQTDDGRLYANNSASMLAFPIMLIFMIPFFLEKNWLEKFKEKWQAVLILMNPAFRPYDYSLLTNVSLWLIPASWITQYMANLIHADWPHVILGLIYLYL